MRMIIEPGTDKEGQPLAQTEDVRIHFFNRDETEKNIYLQGITLQVPLNCGVFAKAAMLKGFFEHFDKMVSGDAPLSPDFQKLLDESDQLLMKFKQVLTVSQAKVQMQNMKDEPTEDTPKKEPTPINKLSQKQIQPGPQV